MMASMELAFSGWDEEIEARRRLWPPRALGASGGFGRQIGNFGKPSKKSASIHAIIIVRSGTMKAFRTVILAAKATTCTSIRISS
jgi:hypothetical protein